MNAKQSPDEGRGGVSTTARSEQGVGELISQASQQVSDLVRQEMRLAVAEMKEKGRHAGLGAGMFSGAALVALFGVGALVAAAIAGVAVALPVWAAALIIGGALLAVAGILAVLGRGQAGRAGPPVPQQAMEGVKQDVAEVKERAHR